MTINKALLKYGYSKFSLEILEYCEPSKCIDREQYYLDLLKPEYNILPIAGSSFGFLHSEETKKRMSEARLGIKFTDDTKIKLSEANKGKNNPLFGKTHSEETKNKISVANLGKTRSEETKAKLKEAKKGNQNRLGKIHSEETKVKLSEAKKGKPRPFGSGRPSQQISVVDISKNETICYSSICEAARALSCAPGTIRYFFKNPLAKPYKDRFIFKKS